MVAIFGIIIFGFLKLQNAFWPIVTLVIAGLISYLVFYRENSKENTPARSASPVDLGWLGIIAGTYLIGFYILLYWAPAYINNWIVMVSPISESLSGNAASNWFLYGLMYSIIVVVMGIRMISKYRHNKYQQVRTLSVMFFQTAFAFLIPEILVRLNQPWFDFKNIWPLDYDFFFKYNLEELTSSGSLGIFMLGWGILLILIGVPVITYFFGKRWYCSWVCGCGGLAETMGDPFRQLSDKSLRAWKYERFIIHGVLLAAVIMTILVLYHYFTGSNTLLGLNSDNVKSWYGFLIGAGFSGVVGTGFYPIMGNRVWCRFGCPLAAYLGLVQKFKSRFRITTNGGQCISCGNCSTYCEMGIDVRSYAQRGQDIIRSSCVGCGVCAAVCPRGVLRLENADGDILDRGEVLRTVHITEDEIKILN
ncbi:MAG: 4Fe-4S binding protein [Saprospiraceae bacterium]|nr:4Fe-4S binding protein [Saprospiraceae bacterium]